MTTIENQKGKRAHGGFISIYKPGQGKYVRWGTVAGLGIVILAGAYWIVIWVLSNVDTYVKTAVGAAWVGVLGLLTFWLVNKPNLAEFMIMTESEMRKVSWPSRREVIASTKVVILLTLLLGVLLWIVDVGFLNFFRAIGLE